MDLKGGALHSRTGGDRPSHGHQGGDQAMNNLGWFRGSIARMAVAAGIGLAGGFGTNVGHAAGSPSPRVSPGVSPSARASPSAGASPSTPAPPTPSPGRGSGEQESPEMYAGHPL